MAILEAAVAEAALAFGKSFGEAAGKQLGDAAGKWLATALFGNTSSDDSAKRLADSLEKISSQLAQILDYLVERLPEVVFDAAQKVSIDAQVKKTQTSWSRVKDSLNAGKDSERIEAISNALDQSEVLLRYGSQYHTYGLLTILMGLSVSRHLSTTKQTELGKKLRSRGGTFISIIDSWLDPSNPLEIQWAFNSRLSQYAEASRITKLHVSGAPYFLMKLGSDYIKDASGSVWIYKAWVGYLDDHDKSTGNWIGGFKAMRDIGGPTQLPGWGAFLLENVPQTKQKPIQLDWFDAVVNTSEQPGDILLRAGRTLDAYNKQVANIPPIVGVLTEALDSIGAFRRICVSLQ